MPDACCSELVQIWVKNWPARGASSNQLKWLHYQYRDFWGIVVFFLFLLLFFSSFSISNTLKGVMFMWRNVHRWNKNREQVKNKTYSYFFICFFTYMCTKLICFINILFFIKRVKIDKYVWEIVYCHVFSCRPYSKQICAGSFIPRVLRAILHSTCVLVKVTTPCVYHYFHLWQLSNVKFSQIL